MPLALLFWLAVLAFCIVGALLAMPRHQGAPRIRRPYVTRELRR